MKIFNECKHEKVSYYTKSSYCPDCGEYIENKYYIVRCSCCHIKRKGIIKGEKILPENTFCHNCGSEKFYLEELETPNFFDLDYLIIKKEIKQIIKHHKHSTCQIWVEVPKQEKKQLLPVLKT